MMQFDWSTIKLDVISQYPMVNTDRFRISDSYGASCFLDAPGFPTYFQQSVYTPRGDQTDKYDHAIRGFALPLYQSFYGMAMEKLKEWFPEHDWKWYWKYQNEVANHLRHQYYMSIWNPLPYHHERVRTWEAYLYSYFKNCWMPYSAEDDEDEVVVWLNKNQGIDASKRSHVSGFNCHIKPPEWDKAALSPAYRMVKKFYPDAPFQPELLVSDAYSRTGNWWEMLPARPHPSECPGEPWSPPKKHPVNNTWCQVCGWREDEKTV